MPSTVGTVHTITVWLCKRYHNLSKHFNFAFLTVKSKKIYNYVLFIKAYYSWCLKTRLVIKTLLRKHINSDAYCRYVTRLYNDYYKYKLRVTRVWGNCQRDLVLHKLYLCNHSLWLLSLGRIEMQVSHQL